MAGPEWTSRSPRSLDRVRHTGRGSGHRFRVTPLAILPGSIYDWRGKDLGGPAVQLTILESTPDVMRVGYDCACGCHPEVSHAHGGDTAYDVCCCGNEFAVGRPNEAGLVVRDG